MRLIARTLMAVAACHLLLSASLGAAEPPAGAPTIEEMLSAVEGAAAGDDGAPAAPGPREATASRTRTAAPKAPPDVQAEMKAVKARAGLLVALHQRHRRFYHLADVSMKFGNHKQALRVVTDMVRKRLFHANKSPVPNADDLADRSHLHYLDGSYGQHGGYAEAMLARTLIRLGAEKEAAKALDDARAKQQRRPDYVLVTHRRYVQSATEFVAGYAKAKEKLEELEAALAEAPTAELQWAYVTHCSPPANRAVEHLKWLEALLVMLEKYPGHESVTKGLAHWQLFHAYRAFGMHEKSAEALDRLAEAHPAIHLHVGPWNAHAQDVPWQKASSWAEMGLLQEELRDRRALVSYRNALGLFEAFQKANPKSPQCVPGVRGVSIAQTRIGALHTAILRVSK